MQVSQMCKEFMLHTQIITKNSIQLCNLKCRVLLYCDHQCLYSYNIKPTRGHCHSSFNPVENTGQSSSPTKKRFVSHAK